ncbi:MAG TPA: cupredoxin domain-containing protein [Solirubrobacteraceae bacterium]|nr:cupredoxin domain-containing protein [Solirubrobacteraceae bacterium]
MRSPLHSEPEAFRFVLLLTLALIPVVLAAALGPTWLAVVVLAVVLGALAWRAVQMHMRKLRGVELPVKMAPPHVGSAAERRVLVVANDTLREEALLSEVERLASVPDTHVLVLAPAVISPGARLTGAVDGLLEQARARLKTALNRVGHDGSVAGEISEADPLEAVEDTFATFAPDEVIVCTRCEPVAGGLEPQLAGLVRDRFAVPVRHLVVEPGSAAQEPDKEAEARYRHEVGDAAARKFGFKALAGAGIAAAVLMSMIALVQSSERDEARASSKAAAEAAAGLPPVAKVVALEVIAEGKRGPEGEKHDEFTTTEFTVRAGQPQELRIDNTDEVPHSITAPEAGVNIVVMPGVHTYTLLVKQPGRYLWFCTFRCDEWAMEHPGYMSGYITVT